MGEGAWAQEYPPPPPPIPTVQNQNKGQNLLLVTFIVYNKFYQNCISSYENCPHYSFIYNALDTIIIWHRLQIVSNLNLFYTFIQ